MVTLNGDAYLWYDQRLHLWTPAGYHTTQRNEPNLVQVLTPEPIVAAIRQGLPMQTALHIE